MTVTELIKSGIKNFNLSADEQSISKMERFLELLEQKNKVMNLTSITNLPDAAEKHMLDCLSIPSFIDLSGKKVIDVGCGAGFPGVPIKLICPSADITFLDSTEKKLNFIFEALGQLDVNAGIICTRAEDAARRPELRECFDISVSRAVAPLNILSELCLPLVKPGGLFIAMKSINCGEELKNASRAIDILGGGEAEIFDYPLYPSNIIHRLVIIKKFRKTPDNYPRRFNQIKNKPL